MAHHQHHGADYDAQVSRSLQTRPNSSSTSQMPLVSEDDLLAEPDEPPELYHGGQFTKSVPYYNTTQRQSLLTRALGTDTESHDEHPMPEPYFGHVQSLSSTASNFSSRSNGDFTSDDGHHSPSTRASTPSSPRSVTYLPKILLNSDNRPRRSSPSHHESEDDSRQSMHSSGDATPEPTVEAKLGRKRCITFACGGKDTSNVKVVTTPKPEPQQTVRPCAIRFMCPFTAAKLAKADHTKTSRRLSPAPGLTKSETPKGFHRRHRDSDTTIKSESLKTNKPLVEPISEKRIRRASNNSDLGRSDACKFHEFATSDDDVEEWTRESTCHMSRLTVTDTLKKENDIRQLAEEADEEDELEEEQAKEAASDEAENFSDDAVSDAGFQTDDEEGFAESDDDENDSDSDYEWWAPRRSRNASPFIGSDVFRPVLQRQFSDSSMDSSDEERPPTIDRGRQRFCRSSAVQAPVRSRTPELPDSTDFVCGTLDEDRPLEQAYISCIQQRKAAKHRTVPQDIDPSFPTSDPEIENDDEDAAEDVDESDGFFIHGRLDNIDNKDEPRGRRFSPAPLRSPHASPKRLRSPPPPAKKAQLPRSPCPRALFNRSSPRRFRSPAPHYRGTSPPPSPRVSATRSTATGPTKPLAIGIPFLGERNNNLTHTASLPRSPHPCARRRAPSALCMKYDDEDEGESTEHAKPYTRGAMDIAQGLERKRLKRREKFYRQYLRKEEKKKTRRPQPGRGAERMRQVGLECATLRGKRMLSI